MSITLEHPQGKVEIDEAGGGRYSVRIQPADPGLFVAAPSCKTTYPPELVERILRVKGPDYVCDELKRDEDPTYVQLALRHGLLGYLDAAAFDGARLLDFGCGCGASTAILGRMFPRLQVVGVELLRESAEVASARLAHYGLSNAEVLVSPDSSSLPPAIGRFDFVLLSAVWEHLLPPERRALLPMLWQVLRPGGVLFLNQTPYRWSPWESHTTGLPLLNYLPAPLALWVARRCSQRVGADEPWESLLRRGIRGGSVREIMDILGRTDEEPLLLEPRGFGCRDRIDLWFRASGAVRWSGPKRAMWATLKGVKAVTGVTLLPSVALAIRKGGQGVAD